MAEYTQNNDFTDKVMEAVRRYHHKKLQRQKNIERLLEGLPIRTVLSLIATACTLYHFGRLYFMWLTPVICR